MNSRSAAQGQEVPVCAVQTEGGGGVTQTSSGAGGLCSKLTSPECDETPRTFH